MAFPPTPFRVPAALPDRIDRIVATLDYTAEAVERDWRGDRIWVLEGNLENLRRLLDAGFLRAGSGPTTATVTATGRRARIDIAADGMTPAFAVLVVRALVLLHTRERLPRISPEVELVRADVVIEGEGPARTPLEDRLFWPEALGPAPSVTPATDPVLLRDAEMPLAAPVRDPERAADVLEAATALAGAGAFVPLGTDTGEVDPIDCAAWLHSGAGRRAGSPLRPSCRGTRGPRSAGRAAVPEHVGQLALSRA